MTNFYQIINGPPQFEAEKPKKADVCRDVSVDKTNCRLAASIFSLRDGPPPFKRKHLSNPNLLHDESCLKDSFCKSLLEKRGSSDELFWITLITPDHGPDQPGL